MSSLEVKLSLKDLVIFLTPDFYSKKYQFDALKELFIKTVQKNVNSLVEDIMASPTKSEDPTTTEKITLEIIENIKVSIENVHIRIENTSDSALDKSAFGFLFENFEIPALNSSDKDSVFIKHVTLKNFSIYHDRNLKTNSLHSIKSNEEQMNVF